MVSGWDKSPGPGNDYASKPWPRLGWIAFAIMIALILFEISYAVSHT